MALEELRKEIEHEARASAKRLDSEAGSESSKIIGEARAQAASIKKGASDSAAIEAENRRRDALTSIDIECGAMLSAAREEAISRQEDAFARVVRRRMSSRISDIIRSSLKRFSDAAPLDHAVVKVDKRNASLIKQHVGKIEYSQGLNGIVISSIDGMVSADATIDGLVGSNADVLRRVLSKGMFG